MISSPSSAHMKNNTIHLVRSALVSALRQEYGDQPLADTIPNDFDSQRKLLGDMLIASNTHWKQETLKLIDELYQNEYTQRDVVTLHDALADPASVSSVYRGTRLAVWQGDITSLSVDAIVNAANDEGLGCFVPHHRCIDNVIHRAAGPRLRLACKTAMKQRPRSSPYLTAGSHPTITHGFFLPAHWVIHVTGPQVSPSALSVSKKDRDCLASAYKLSLDSAVEKGIKTIAFPCISTGLFGFPAEEASLVALSAVYEWLDEHEEETLDAIIFDVFTEMDQALYQENFQKYLAIKPADIKMKDSAAVDSMDGKMKGLAKTWIDQADSILICAGAGMSVKEHEMVYTSSVDFTKHYPYFTKWGYHTAYEAMGLFGDPTTPLTAKWAFWAKHFDNMRYSFSPNEGYDHLRQLVGSKDHFVVTSNVDGCFERAGFDPSKIYSPQGDYGYLQCMKPCHNDSVYDARPYLDNLLPNISQDGHIPVDLIPKCPRCGSDMFGNVRGGSWFLHEKYDAQNQAAVDWMKSQKDKKVVVIEVGAGFNTPMVTRWPMEAFVRENGGKLIRINPSDPETPFDVNGLSFAQGWQVLGDILCTSRIHSQDQMEETLREVREFQQNEELIIPVDQTQKVARYMGHFHWKLFLENLRR